MSAIHRPVLPNTGDDGPSPTTICRVCRREVTTTLFTLGSQYVSAFVEPGEEQKGLKIPITLDLCKHCGLVQQRYSAPTDHLFRGKYWYRSGVTQTMRHALAELAQAALRRIQLQEGDLVIDIGANDGTLLRCIPPEYRRVAVEPATNMRQYYNEEEDGIHLVNDFWSYPLLDNHGQPITQKARLIFAAGMLYDLEDPNTFIRDVAAALAPDGLFVAQLQCLRQTLELGDVGNFCHEHLEFYSLRCLTYLLRSHGLEIYDIVPNLINGGSYRLYIGHEGQTVEKEGSFQHWIKVAQSRLIDHLLAESVLELDTVATYTKLYDRMDEQRRVCLGFLERARYFERKRIWVYGASTKGNVILQWYGLGKNYLLGAADRSPEKIGKVLPASGLQIYNEEDARRALPDYFLVLPYAFIDEFVEREAQEAWRQAGGEFIVPLPTFRVL